MNAEKDLNGNNGIVNEKKNITEIKLIKDNISNIDLYFIAYELNALLADGFITNVYELPGSKILRLKCRTKSGTYNIIVDPQRRVNYTIFQYPADKFPSQFIMGLRKYMKGRRIKRVYQYNFDRILVFELESNEGPPWKFVLELFKKGNYILVDGEEKVLFANQYQKFRDRDLLPKRPYIFPPSFGINLMDVDLEVLKDIIRDKKKEIVRVLARAINIGGYIVEEICLRAGVDKKTKAPDIDEAQLQAIYRVIEEFKDILGNYEYSPRLYLDDMNQAVGFEPFEFKLYSHLRIKEMKTLNEAVDEFFSRFESDLLYGTEVKKAKTKLNKYEKILKKQTETVEKLRKKLEENQRLGELIYQHLYTIDNLIKTIMEQKKIKGRSWKEIEAILNKGKTQNIPECLIFDKILEKELKIQINIDGNLIKLDMNKTASENAQDLYAVAAKSRKKIEGALRAIEDTKKKLEKYRKEHSDLEEDKKFLIKSPKKRWFEKFHWFITSDGFLVIGGRNASSNEIIVKKYMGPNDLFFHTESRGASVCIIKNDENKEIPETSIKETAIFAASHSSAWKKGWGAEKIYFVKPDQVSKTPKAGEYLTKGSFIIKGKKNYLEKPELVLGIGVKFIPVNDERLEEIFERDFVNLVKGHEIPKIKEDGEEIQFYPKFISAPESAIKKQTPYYVLIRPSKNPLKSSDLAKSILNELGKKVPEVFKRWLRMGSLDELIRLIPAGGGVIVGIKNGKRK